MFCIGGHPDILVCFAASEREGHLANGHPVETAFHPQQPLPCLPTPQVPSIPVPLHRPALRWCAPHQPNCRGSTPSPLLLCYNILEDEGSCLYGLFIPFLGGIFHSMKRPCFVCSFTCWCTMTFFPGFAVMKNVAINVLVQFVHVVGLCFHFPWWGGGALNFTNSDFVLLSAESPLLSLSWHSDSMLLNFFVCLPTHNWHVLPSRKAEMRSKKLMSWKW